MRRHWIPAFILCALAIAGCQPSQSSAASQTQSAQSAFDEAVAAAQTQAAPPRPTARPAPTMTLEPTLPPTASGPVPTHSWMQLGEMARWFRFYLDEAVRSYEPEDGSPYEASVDSIEYGYYDENRAAYMYVNIKKSNETADGPVIAAAVNAFIAIYRRDVRSEAWWQASNVPSNLRLFRLYIHDSNGQETLRFSGDWQDVIAFSQGSLAKDEFMQRLKFEQAAE